jgi:predicted nucleotidyltransferase component of viral defense system
MIDPDEVRAQALAWGTAESQVRKDHLISHLLLALRGLPGFVFFGGTALNRTFLRACRLSEDMDLFLQPHEPGDSVAIIAALHERTRREFPDLAIVPTGSREDVRSYGASAEDLQVRIQIVGPRHEHGLYPTEMAGVALRYSDLPASVALRIPTREAFVAMKCAAYEDRGTPRDLFDLGALAEIGAIGPSVVEVLLRLRGYGPMEWPYNGSRCPSATEWAAELAHQTRHSGDPLEVLCRVRSALAPVCGWQAGE